ncbi:MAG: Spy/CpxP family protein refolding chaperone [Gammaproteobacteria bacterium]|nr:Spy/CpxP family protein refolding chaperone [Gammaproteobacteria bacterium]
MHFKSLSFIFSCIVCSLLLFGGDAYADRPLKSALDLNTEQAAKVAAIQKEARDAMRKPRGDLHRKQRELRRAEVANDSTAIARLEKEISPLQEKMKHVHDIEEQKIRAVLTGEQTGKYEQWLQERDAMVGSSRDVKDYRE